MRRSWVAFALLAVVLAGFLQTQHRMFLRLSYLFAGLIVVSFLWAWLGLEWVALSRKLEARGLHVGEVARERLSLANRGFLPKLWVEVRDRSELPGHRASRVVNSLWPFSSFTWEVRTACRWRGKYRIGQATLASGDPFGIFRLEKKVDRGVDFFVFPATFSLEEAFPEVGILSGGRSHRWPTPHTTTNATGIRDYAHGDSFSRIHWPSTARLGEVMVREFEFEPMGKAWIFLDMQEEVQVGVDLPQESLLEESSYQIPPNTVEYGVAIAASLVKEFLGQDLAVGLVSYTQERQVLPLDRGPRQYIRLMELLAMIEGKGRTPLAEAIVAEGTRLGPDTLVVAISPSSNGDWARVLEGLLVRGIRAVGISLEATSFPGVMPRVGSSFTNSAIPVYTVRCGQSLEGAFHPERPKVATIR